ncbi:MAG TPA: hypothetical protein VM536_15855 [Chloroflexia bacterium]|nr:hypothetical protein [Chloroflexia bacterium]
MHLRSSGGAWARPCFAGSLPLGLHRGKHHPYHRLNSPVVLDAVCHEPDPARLDSFLGDLSSEAMKKHLSKWTK